MRAEEGGSQSDLINHQHHHREKKIGEEREGYGSRDVERRVQRPVLCSFKRIEGKRIEGGSG